jgi:hypothetical protein
VVSVECGKCGKEIDDGDLLELFDGRTHFDVECACGATLEIEAYAIPEFVVLRTRPLVTRVVR